MTDKEKLEKLMKLADAMYYAAQNLTTDASRLHKAMDEYHKFIIYEYHKEEPKNDWWLQELHNKLDSLSKEDFDKVWAKYHQKEEFVSEDLDIAASEYLKQNYDIDNIYEEDDLSIRNTFKAGAQWQKLKLIYKAIIYNDKIYPTTYENEPTEFCLDGGEEVRLITEAVNSGLLKQGDKVKVIIIKAE